jgi:hypothetical protein
MRGSLRGSPGGTDADTRRSGSLDRDGRGGPGRRRPFAAHAPHRRGRDPRLPSQPESELTVAWRGEQIAVCHESPDINRCWDIDPTSASVVSTRTSAPGWLAATYYIIGLHPDGKRAAVVDTARGIGVVDLATRQVRFFPAEDPEAKRPAGAPGGDPARIYFVGESVFLVSQVADAHSDLTAYSQAGKLLWREFLEVYNGTVSITGPQTLAINQHGLRNLILHDVASGTRKTIRRRVPKGPCDPSNLLAMRDDGPQRCLDYVDRYFAPFRGVHVLRSKQRFIGYDAFTRELVEIDGRLNPGKRVPVRCLTNP